MARRCVYFSLGVVVVMVVRLEQGWLLWWWWAVRDVMKGEWERGCVFCFIYYYMLRVVLENNNFGC